jgi:hypothetical protein
VWTKHGESRLYGKGNLQKLDIVNATTTGKTIHVSPSVTLIAGEIKRYIITKILPLFNKNPTCNSPILCKAYKPHTSPS